MRLYHSWLSGDSFVSPVVLENADVPAFVGTSSKIDTSTNEDLAVPGAHIFYGGYLWNLEIFPDNTIVRYPFSSGNIGDAETISISGDAAGMEGYYVKPVEHNGVVYFLDWSSPTLVAFDTGTLTATKYTLPFDPWADSNYRYKTALGIDDGRLFIFGNCRVYELTGGNIVDRGPIAYSFGDDVVDYSGRVNYVRYVKVINTGSALYVVLYGDFFGIAAPTWTNYEILLFDSSDYSFNKTVAEAKFNSHLKDRADWLYIGDGKVLTIASYNESFFTNINYYKSEVHLFDLMSGDIQFVGNAALPSPYHTTLHQDGGNIYAVCTDYGGYNAESYQLTFDNLLNATNQVNGPIFLEYDGNLYATWAHGLPFDGTWNTSQDTLNDYLIQRNKYIELVPSLGSVQDLSTEYIGRLESVNGNYLTTQRAELWELGAGFTLGARVYDSEIGYSYCRFRSYDSVHIGATTQYDNSSAWDLTLIADDLTTEIVPGLFQGSRVASYGDVILGGGYKNNTLAIVKVDSTAKERFECSFGYGRTSDPYNQVSFNASQVAAAGWNRFIAVADLSGDIIPPTVDILNSGGETISGSTLTLNWIAGDNTGTLQRSEVYKEEGGVRTLLSEISDVGVFTYDYEVPAGKEGEITFLVFAYDNEGNWGYDTVTYTAILPVVLTSFNVDKTSLNLGDMLEFSWSATGVDLETVYTLDRRAVGGENWEEYFQAVGDTSREVLVNDMVGDYEFRLRAGSSEIVLPATIHIGGELFGYDYGAFGLANNGFYGENRAVLLNWGSVLSPGAAVLYKVYVREPGGELILIGETTDTHYEYSFPEGLTTFEWQVVAEYCGGTIESDVQSATVTALTSPDISALEVQNNDTDAPVVVGTFEAIPGVTEYLVRRESSSGEISEFSVIGEISFTDDSVVYGEEYAYQVSSIAGDLVGSPGTVARVYVWINEVNAITILNEDYAILDGNSVTILYEPDPATGAYERYEVLLGVTVDALEHYAFTSAREVTLSDLNYDTRYTLAIHALDHRGNRITGTAADLVFTTGKNPHLIEVRPEIVVTAHGENFVELSWTAVPKATAYEILRSLNGGAFSSTGVTELATYRDETGIAVGNIYGYVLRAFNPSSFLESEPAFVAIKDASAPTLTLLGDAEVTVGVGEAYADAGASAIDAYEGDLTPRIVTLGAVNTSLVGDYTVIYNVSDTAGNAAEEVRRIVSVRDTTAPVITLSGPSEITTEVHEPYSDAGATVEDNYDATISVLTSGIVNVGEPGDYILTYEATDSSGNLAEPMYRTVHVVDTTPPVIMLVGESEVTVECGEAYSDAGATASDNYDGNITARVLVVNEIDPLISGVYSVTYDVSDSVGNAALQLTRTVYVEDTTPPVIEQCAADPGPLSLDVNCEVALPDLSAAVVAHDSCGEPVVTQEPMAGTILSADTPVTVTVRDGAGLTDTCNVTVTVRVCDTEGEGEVLPEGEGEIVPEGEGEVLPEGEGEVLPEVEGEILPEGEGEVLAEGEGEVLPEGEGEILPEGEGEVLAEGEGEVLAEGEGEVLPEGEGEVVPEGEGEVLPEGEGEVQPEGEGEVLLEGEGEVLPEGEGEGEVPPEGEGEVLPEGEGEVIPEGEGEVLPEGEGEVQPEGEGEVQPEGEGEVLPEGEGEVLPEGEGEIMPEGEGEIIPEGEGEVLPEGEGEILPEGEGEVLPEGEGEVLPEGEGEILPEGEGEVLPEGEGEILPEGEGEVLPEGEGEILPEGEGEFLPEGEGEVVAEGEGEILPEGEGEGEGEACGCCTSGDKNLDLRGMFKRTLGDWMLVGLSLVALMALVGARR